MRSLRTPRNSLFYQLAEELRKRQEAEYREMELQGGQAAGAVGLTETQPRIPVTVVWKPYVSVTEALTLPLPGGPPSHGS